MKSQMRMRSLLEQMLADHSNRTLGYFQKLGQAWKDKIAVLRRVVKDEHLALAEKVVAYGALFYLITPFDLIPDHVRTPPSFQMPKFVVPPEGISFKDVITNVEKRLIESTLEASGGVQKRAAELLHIKPTTLNEMIKRYDIKPRRKKDDENDDRPPSSSRAQQRLSTAEPTRE